jgi:hypothetical protein
MNLKESIREVAPYSLVERPTVEIAGDIPVRQGPVELEPVKLGVDLAKTSGASPPMPVQTTITNTTTKADPEPRKGSNPGRRAIPPRCRRGPRSRSGGTLG